jgi:hypothetical protein
MPLWQMNGKVKIHQVLNVRTHLKLKVDYGNTIIN